MTKHITQKPGIIITAKSLPSMKLDVILSEEFRAEQEAYDKECYKLAALAESAPELLRKMESLLFIAESVAHMKGMEREILPTTESLREYIKQFKE